MIASLNEVKDLLKNPYPLIISGKKETLKKIPPGNWIGGTVPFLIQDQGRELERDELDITVMPPKIRNAKIKTYSLDNIHLIKHDGFEQGLSFIIIPSESDVHRSFAMNSREYPCKNKSSLIGWVAGHPADETRAWSVYGPKQSFFNDRAVVLHCQLKPGYISKTERINIFTPGDGPLIEFKESGFTAQQVCVEGQTISFAQYLKDLGAEIDHPLIAMGEEGGENVSFKQILEQEVQLYAPVFKYKQYKLARKEENYYRKFMNEIQKRHQNDSPLFACNCILNYSYDDLSGKDIGNLKGPVTFGEIADNLLNQTFVSVRIQDQDRDKEEPLSDFS